MALITGVFDEITDSISPEDYSIGPILDSGLFDQVILAVPNNEHCIALKNFAQHFDVDFFAGDEFSVLERISQVLEKHPSDCISRFQLRASWVDITLVRGSLDCIASGYDYADYNYDVNYAMGCDSFSYEAFQKAKRLIAEIRDDDARKATFEFSPWALMQRRSIFNVGMVEVAELYSEGRARSLRRRLDKLIGDKQNMIGSPVNRPATRYIKAAEFLNPAMRVAEISCGWGGGSAYISQFCESLEAYEVNKDYVKFARENYSDYPVTYINGGDHDLVKRKFFFDAIVSLHTLEHVQDDAFFLTAIFEALKIGGILILEVPRLLPKPMGMPLWPFHEREYNLAELRVLLDETGFRIEDEFGVSRNEYVDIAQAREAMMIICSRQS